MDKNTRLPKVGPKAAPSTAPASLWSNRNFLYLWTGTILSNFGYQIYLVALPLLIYDMTRSALAMSMMRAIDFFPNIMIGMVAGVIVDRFSRKRVMSISVLLRLFTLAGIMFLLYANRLELWHLYVLGFVLSAAGYTFGNSHHSVLPLLVDKKQLTAANAQLTFVDTLIMMVGPGVAGVLIAAFSYEVSLGIFLACIVLLWICVSLTRIPETASRATGAKFSVWKEMKEGIDALLDNKVLLTPTLAVLFNNFSASLTSGVLMFFAVDVLHATDQQVGLMIGMGAAGGMVGSVCIPWLRKRYGRGRLYVGCVLTEVLGFLLLVFAHAWWVIGFGLFIRTFAITMSNVVYFTIRQEFTPNHLLGRVAGTSSMLMKLALPLGLFISGIWAEYLPIPLLFLMSAVLTFMMFLILRKHSFANVQ
ncbi:MFS transporter [Paenibacillus campinasensis]|uniref:MFS transporter n=1 Tax=Paenibacillus campinasensis TaxID=66347 RepID=A0ABW9T408_9BACL|nr:MFS transporter [Paenibacillus campinasensis]MUG67802.1 MFS transporter [Paenibacillus campinasensis]